MTTSASRGWLLYVAAAAALLSMIGLGVAVGYHLASQKAVDEKLCEGAVANREAIRGTWNAARELVLLTADDPKRINEFFDGVLRPIPALECIDNQPVPKEG